MNPAMLVDVNWPAPPRVRTFSTTRLGGVSEPPFAGLNLSCGAGDSTDAVMRNLALLTRAADLPHRPRWPRQVHGTGVISAEELAGESPQADAVMTTTPGRICSVRTADCLPVLLCDRNASCVAAAHAGWRGLAAGVLEQTVAALPAPPAALMAWLGPAIGPSAFEVGDEVRAAFLEADPDCIGCFVASPRDRWLADLYALARRRLSRAGVRSLHGGGWCTHSDAHRFFSYRRDGATGRMASGIWIAGDA